VCGVDEESVAVLGKEPAEGRKASQRRRGRTASESVCAEETRAARTRGSQRNPGKSPFLYFFSFGFVCVCVS